MPRAKKRIDEFNPWPPFVDVFSSIILVLLLFILVTIVNIAYYMQFNSKAPSESTVNSTTNNLTRGMDVTDMITLKKAPKPSVEKGGNESLFSGGEASGNAMIAANDQTRDDQNIKKLGEKEIIIEFNSKEIFMDKRAKSRISLFIKNAKSRNKDAKIELSISNPTAMGSETLAKQISLGRVLNAKNFIKKGDYKLSDISLKIEKTEDEKYKFGYVKLRIIQ